MRLPEPAPTTAPIVLGPTDGEKLTVVADEVRVLADGSQTGGRLFIFEVKTPPGEGPPLHRHAVDAEFFFIIEGTYRFVLEGKEFLGTAGSFIHCPRGSLHTFSNAGKTMGRMLLVTTPAGLEGPFRETSRAAAAGGLSPQALGAIFGGFGITFEGPPLGAR